METEERRKAKKRWNSIVVTTHHKGEAAVSLTVYDPVVSVAAPVSVPQYYHYAQPVAQVFLSIRFIMPPCRGA